MKKILALVLATAMVAALGGCGGGETPESSTPSTEAPSTEGTSSVVEDAVEDTVDDIMSVPGMEGKKIAIITGTVSQGEEEFRAGEKMQEKYGDMIVTATYPDAFAKEQETTISNVENLVSQEGVEALVFVQAVPGATAAIQKARELNPDLLVIAGVVQEDPSMISAEADVVLNANEIEMGIAIADQAQAMGAKTVVHYSFPRHMGIALLSARRDALKTRTEELGMVYVEATTPDPTGDAGVSGVQQFIVEDVPKMIENYGADTAFFGTNCSMQEPLIREVMEGKAILPQQCCPSPYHAYPGALGIAIPTEKAGDVEYLLGEITAKVAEGGNAGRMATWPVPVNMLFVEAGVEYAIDYLTGETTERSDMAAMKTVADVIADGDMNFGVLEEDGVVYENFYTLLSPYHVF